MNQPQLIVQDFIGANNADLAKSGARIIKGGSWKKQRIIVIVPADVDQEEISPDGKRVVMRGIPGKVYLSHSNLIYPPNNGVVKILAQGMECGIAYSTAFEQILAHPELRSWEYVLTLEWDNCPPQDAVLKLLERMEEHPEFSAISGAYFTKGPMGQLQCWGDVSDPCVNFRPQVPVEGKLIECHGLGMGCCLFRLKMFHDERLRRPWFVTQKGPTGVSTQDLYAWSDFRKYGYRAAVDCSVKVGHLDVVSGIMW